MNTESQISLAPRDRIMVRDYVLDVEIGAFQAERGTTQRVRFNVEVEVAGADGAATDDVDGILSYDTIVDAIGQALVHVQASLLGNAGVFLDDDRGAARDAGELAVHQGVLCLTMVAGHEDVSIALGGRGHRDGPFDNVQVDAIAVIAQRDVVGDFHIDDALWEICEPELGEIVDRVETFHQRRTDHRGQWAWVRCVHIRRRVRRVSK